MGAQQSSTDTSVDIATSFVTNATTTATNRCKVGVSSGQKIDLSCDADVSKACSQGCKEAEMKRNDAALALVGARIITSAEYTAMTAKPPAACMCCSADNIDLEMILTITMSDISDNKIANDIKAAIASQLDSQIANKTSGTIGYSDSQVNSLTNIKNYVNTNFNTTIVNETLKTFNFDQSIVGKNVWMKNTTQKMVADVISSNLVNNAISNSAALAADIKAVTSVDQSNSGVGDNIQGMFESLMGLLGSPAMIAIIVAIVFAVLVAGGIFLKFKMGSASAATAPAPVIMAPSAPAPQLMPQDPMSQQALIALATAALVNPQNTKAAL